MAKSWFADRFDLFKLIRYIMSVHEHFILKMYLISWYYIQRIYLALIFAFDFILSCDSSSRGSLETLSVPPSVLPHSLISELEKYKEVGKGW